MNIRTASVIFGAFVFLMACGGGDGSDPTPGTGRVGQTGATVTTQETTTTVPEIPETPDPTASPPPTAGSTPDTSSAGGATALPERAVADLATRLGIDPREIRLVSFEEVDWPDGSIGCPQPGMSYTQAIVNGSRIVLEANDILYNYHMGGNRDLFLCEQPESTEKTPPPTLEF